MVLTTAEVHEDDDYAKKVLAKTEFPNAFVVNLNIEEVFA
ncbi:MAG: pyridoxamine 5'-phosphate oxidase family protein, partial [Lactobacillus sp.]|nr:pyridoxamine 5'-phosphate oxidase family protein [Lactobacillus sp.]